MVKAYSASRANNQGKPVSHEAKRNRCSARIHLPLPPLYTTLSRLPRKALWRAARSHIIMGITGSTPHLTTTGAIVLRCDQVCVKKRPESWISVQQPPHGASEDNGTALNGSLDRLQRDRERCLGLTPGALTAR